MIVIVRKKNNSSKILKLIIIAVLFFGIVYISLLIKEEKLLSIELEKAKEDEKIALQVEQEKKEKEKLDAQRVILIEVEKVVDLIGQNNINDIKIIAFVHYLANIKKINANGISYILTMIENNMDEKNRNDFLDMIENKLENISQSDIQDLESF